MQWSKTKKHRQLTAILTAAALFFTGGQAIMPPAQAAQPHAEQTNLALDKTVYYSSEEGTSTSGADTHAANAVDGDKTTCWSANGKPDGTNWDAQYPEWLCVDLGKPYNLSQINLIFEGKMAHGIMGTMSMFPTKRRKAVTARFQKGLRKSFPGRTIHSLPQRQAQLQRISQTVPDVMSW